jgi:methyl-accepting chemotaxis protein
MGMIRRLEPTQGNLDDLIRHLQEHDLKGLSFGAFELDEDGTIIRFSSDEKYHGGRHRDEIPGLNFFQDLASCTDNTLFRGVFDQGVNLGQLNENFFFTFTMDHELLPKKVRIYMKKANLGPNYWIFIKPLLA